MRNQMVSIVTPSLNGGRYIEDCIKSIMNQTYKNLEHIIVDGGSQDNTIDIIKKYEHSYNMRWLQEPDKGMYDAINKGFALADGEIFAWLNTDDVYFPWTLEIVSETISCLGIKWLTGIPTYWSKDGLLYNLPPRLPYHNRYYIRKGYYHGKGLGWIQQESTFWTKGLWEKVKGVNGNLRYAGDFYLWKAFAEHSDLYLIDTILGSFRKHDTQKTTVIDHYYQEIREYLNVNPLVRYSLEAYRILATFKPFAPHNRIYSRDIINQ